MMTTGKLWTAYHKTRGVDERNQVICAYLHLAKLHASRITKQLVSHSSYDEIESAAYVGLIKAVERYEPDRKTKFETFSYSRIHGAVMDWLRLRDLQSRTVRAFERSKEKAIRSLSMDGPVSENDVARHLGVSEERYILLSSLSQRGREMYLSFFEKLDDFNHPYQFVDSNAENPSSTVSTEMFINFVLKGLSKSERTVIHHYHFGGLTLREVGKKLGLTESRTSQIKLAAYAQIRSRLQQHQCSNLI